MRTTKPITAGNKLAKWHFTVSHTWLYNFKENLKHNM